MPTFNFPHTDDDCDKCLNKVGKQNLVKVPFLYLDCNDIKHEDVSYLVGHYKKGYRQYYVCKQCIKDGI